jgi:membrane protease YdiL (CAAX protease family)
VSLAVVAQAVVFSLGHVYEGRNAVVTITAYALFFGLIAAWRKSLRSGMIGHAWYDAAVIFLIPR